MLCSPVCKKSHHAFRWSGMPVPTYLLLESQGNWQASRDAGAQAAAHVKQRCPRQFESCARALCSLLRLFKRCSAMGPVAEFIVAVVYTPWCNKV